MNTLFFWLRQFVVVVVRCLLFFLWTWSTVSASTCNEINISKTKWSISEIWWSKKRTYSFTYSGLSENQTLGVRIPQWLWCVDQIEYATSDTVIHYTITPGWLLFDRNERDWWTCVFADSIKITSRNWSCQEQKISFSLKEETLGLMSSSSCVDIILWADTAWAANKTICTNESPKLQINSPAAYIVSESNDKERRYSWLFNVPNGRYDDGYEVRIKLPSWWGCLDKFLYYSSAWTDEYPFYADLFYSKDGGQTWENQSNDICVPATDIKAIFWKWYKNNTISFARNLLSDNAISWTHCSDIAFSSNSYETVTTKTCTYTPDTLDQEVYNAYLFAYDKQLTSFEYQYARLDQPLLRYELAKIMVNFAKKSDNNTLQKNSDCEKHIFNDSNLFDQEMKESITEACSLWLMWLKNDGSGIIEQFDPFWVVTREQFWAILSRYLYGNKYNWWTMEDHLIALQKNGIMHKIDKPQEKEIRGYVFLMLQRIAENNWLDATSK